MPLTLVALWGRYLPRHGWFGTFLLGVLTGLTVFFGWHTFRFARATLRGEAPPPIWLGLGQSWREFRAQGWLGRIFMLLVALTPAALLVCSVGTFWVNPRQPDSWAAKGLNALSFVGIRTYADLREANVAERPDGWDGNDWSKVKRVDLRGRNLAFADATGTFLANADLAQSKSQGRDPAKCSASRLSSRGRGPRVFDQRLQASVAFDKNCDWDFQRIAQGRDGDLGHAQLQGADLSAAELEGANLSYAELQETSFEHARLRGACFIEARLQDANLSGAQLQGANLSQIRQSAASQLMAGSASGRQPLRCRTPER
jgi:uncharacterized protein YjbI with pentapeptide repeats